MTKSNEWPWSGLSRRSILLGAALTLSGIGALAALEAHASTDFVHDDQNTVSLAKTLHPNAAETAQIIRDQKIPIEDAEANIDIMRKTTEIMVIGAVGVAGWALLENRKKTL